MARVPSIVQTEQSFRPLSTIARTLAIGGRTCSNCGSSEIRPSYRRNALDILLACLFLAPFRCRVCRVRFYLVWRRSLQHHEPPMAPLLLVPVRRKIVNLSSTAHRIIVPEPVQPESNPVQGALLSPLQIEVTAVDVTQPASLESALAEPRIPPAKPVTAASILILESDLSIRKLLRRLLERRGHLTVEVAQAEDLDGELRDRGGDLLIVDVSTTGGVSVETAVALAHAHPKLKILALSGASLDGKEIPGRLLALPKPFPLDSFVDCVDRLLALPIPEVSGKARVQRLDHS
jgi:CheY-like chemotaxis protein